MEIYKISSNNCKEREYEIKLNLIIPKLKEDRENEDEFSNPTSNNRLKNVLCKLYKHLQEINPKANLDIGVRYNIFEKAKDVEIAIKNGELKNSINLFVIDIGRYGINIEYEKLIFLLRKCADCENHLYKDALNSSVGGVIVDGKSELFTKKIGREMAFAANMAGCSFVGKSLVEAIGDLGNYDLRSRIDKISREKEYEKSAINLIETLIDFKYRRILDYARKSHIQISEKCKKERPRRKILAIHSSHFKKSNTLTLWEMIKENIKSDDIEVYQVSLAKDNIDDCRGCSHNMCLHYGEQSSCYYGGYIVDEVFPKVLECDAIVMISPNYNDSVSGNLISFINRLTSLYKVNAIEKKAIFSVIVSGYSGSDIIAEQIIGAMSMNKGFFLPPKFVIYERANRANEILECDSIEEKARRFAENIRLSLEKKL